MGVAFLFGKRGERMLGAGSPRRKYCDVGVLVLSGRVVPDSGSQVG